MAVGQQFVVDATRQQFKIAEVISMTALSMSLRGLSLCRCVCACISEHVATVRTDSHLVVL